MSNKNDGGPAYPLPVACMPLDGLLETNQQGMTLRDYFAGQALGALHGQIADIFTTSLRDPKTHEEKADAAYAALRLERIGATAYAIADRLIQEREK